MAEKGDLVLQIVNGESKDDNIKKDCKVELLESSNGDRSECLSNNDHGLPYGGDLDSVAPDTSTVSGSSNAAKSLMECLHRPTPSQFSRKRKIDCNQLPKGKKRSFQ